MKPINELKLKYKQDRYSRRLLAYGVMYERDRQTYEAKVISEPCIRIIHYSWRGFIPGFFVTETSDRFKPFAFEELPEEGLSKFNRDFVDKDEFKITYE